MPARLKSRIPTIMSASEIRVAAAVERAAVSIQQRAMERSRVDTGAMRGGWQATREGSMTWLVSNPVYYTIFNELGTVYMAAQPMLIPAFEETMPEFEADIRKAYV